MPARLVKPIGVGRNLLPMELDVYGPPLSALRDALRAAGFTRARVSKETSLARQIALPELRAGVAALQLDESGDERLASLTAMFGLGDPIPRRRLESLFPALDLAGLEELGLLKLEDDAVAAQFRLTELDGLFFAYDNELDRRPDMVVGVAASSIVGAAYIPRVQVEKALDLGAGCGVHALLASRRAAAVVATDINPRALRLTALNAALNGITNVETRLGSMFEPVPDERFGLITANPPYVISPDTQFLYRDAGLTGDTLCRQLVVGLPRHLEEGGFATIQGNWTHDRDAPWWSPLERDLHDSGCDAYLVRRRTQDPLSYAVGWLSRPALHELDTHAATVRRWRESYREAGIEAITTAVLILRRRTGTNWRQAVTEQAPPQLELGEELPRIFAARDKLPATDLPLTRLRPAPGLHIESSVAPSGEGEFALHCPVALGTRRGASRAAAEFALGYAKRLQDGDGVTPDAPLAKELQTLVQLGFLTLD